MKNATNLIRSQSQYNRHYHDMRGVDFTGDGSHIDDRRFSYLENMYRDYDGEGAGITESIPGFRRLCSLGECIHGIFAQTTAAGKYVLVHAGYNLYRFALTARDEIPAEPAPIGRLAPCKSAAFCHGSSIYLLDGQNLHRVDENGNFLTFAGYKQKEVYIPTTFYNGEPLEQRNLLSIGFHEKYSLEDPLRLAYISQGLRYEIENEGDLTCKLGGRGSCTDEKITVPQRVHIGEAEYSVIAVREGAFENDTALKSIVLPRGLQWIEKRAFAACTQLVTVALMPTLAEIQTEAFAGCTALKEAYIPTTLASLSADAFKNTALTGVYLDGAASALADTVKSALPQTAALTPSTPYLACVLRFPLHGPVSSITDFRIGDEQLFYAKKIENGLITAVDTALTDYTAVIGKEVTISGEMPETLGYQSSAGTDFLYENKDYTYGSVCAIFGCTVCEVFDGRVFLSGNPDLPNTVFYSARDNTGYMNPTYFGSLNYFNDGLAGFPVKSLLAAGDSLAVFKSGDDGGGSIYYHTPETTASPLLPKIYPVTYVHSGIAATAGSLSFYDDPVFVCEEGICALDKKNLSLQRSVTCRSQTVNTRLLTEDLSAVRLAKWRNYLAVLAGEHIYLADAHQTYAHPTGSFAYEWYYLCGIGTYQNDTPVYRYSSEEFGGYGVLEELRDQVVENETVYSISNDVITIYYIIRDNRCYRVYPTEQREGGTLSPARSILGLDEYLFFGTESGDLCLFNNDKRGVPPPSLLAQADFDEKEYLSRNARRIHSDFYDFDHHAPRYALATKRDCCGVPHLTKNTVKSSLTVKCRSYASSSLRLEVGTDRTGYSEGALLPGASFGFDSLDFSEMTLDNAPYFTLAFREKEKHWIEKQIAMYSDTYRGPFGIYSISYRFTIHGGIKNR